MRPVRATTRHLVRQRLQGLCGLGVDELGLVVVVAAVGDERELGRGLFVEALQGWRLLPLR